MDTSRMAQRESRTGSLLAWIGAGGLLIAVGVGWYVLPVSDWLGALRDWIVGLRFAGIVTFAAIYVVGAVVLAPEEVLTIAAGFAWGLWGFPIVLLAATIGASLAFLIARYAAREKIRRLLEHQRNLAAIDKAVAEEGWKIVALLRLSPVIPFNLQNYLFGVTAIPFPHFVAATLCRHHSRDGAVHLSRRAWERGRRRRSGQVGLFRHRVVGNGRCRHPGHSQGKSEIARGRGRQSDPLTPVCKSANDERSCRRYVRDRSRRGRPDHRGDSRRSSGRGQC
jgi:uncharacterized membrane protein YdjX (TVP38/TMEM64 family)